MKRHLAFGALVLIAAGIVAPAAFAEETCADPVPVCATHSIGVGVFPYESVCVYTDGPPPAVRLCQAVSPLWWSSAGADFVAADGTRGSAFVLVDSSPSSPSVDGAAGVSRVTACADALGVCVLQDTSSSNSYVCVISTGTGNTLAVCDNWYRWRDATKTEAHVVSVWGIEGHSPAFAVAGARTKPDDPAVIVGAGVYHGRPNCYAAAVMLERGQPSTIANPECL